MTRELRRLLVSPLRLVTGNQFDLKLTEVHYLTRVLRYQIGDYFIIVDGVGQLWSAILISSNQAYIEQSLNESLQKSMSPSPLIKLVVALPRKGFDNILRMSTELGIDRIQPLIAERCYTSKEQRSARWKTILEEATEQCERLWLPLCGHPCQAERWFQHQEDIINKTTPNNISLKLFATTRSRGLISITTFLNQVSIQTRLPHQICLAIGPEGGWSVNEEKIAKKNGWHPVTLGPRILQTQTAAVAGVTLISHWRIGKNGF